MNNKEINTAFLKIKKRAESSDRTKLVDTFVDVGPLFTLLSNEDHQVLYGRRGTGKTHALIYLSKFVQEKGDVGIYIDIRTIGSSVGLYSDTSLPFSERATRLLSDTLGSIHDEIYNHIIENDKDLNLNVLGNSLDSLADSITEIQVVGDTTIESSIDKESEAKSGSELSMSLSEGGANFGGKKGDSKRSLNKRTSRVSESGVKKHRVHFGHVNQAIKKLIDNLPDSRIWVILDEWSIVPVELQPYLADMLRRVLFPLTRLTVKIGAIEQRSNFYIPDKFGNYIGIEPGADATADLNLDDFMVFDNDADRSTEFFKELIFKHYKTTDGVNLENGPNTPTKLINEAFSQINTFQEFVRSAEGVPRDAINILALAAQKDYSSNITMEKIRAASRSWYLRQKEDAVTSNLQAQKLLHWIIDEVIGHRKARAFLLKSNTKHDLIDSLYDARVLHLLKRNVSSKDEAGIRYDVYKLDYGCYVNLLATSDAPQGLLPFEGEENYLEVPPDDYRAIRRAILDLGKFEETLNNANQVDG